MYTCCGTHFHDNIHAHLYDHLYEHTFTNTLRRTEFCGHGDLQRRVKVCSWRCL